MPSSGPSRAAEEAVARTKSTARKYPGKAISEESIKATATLEIKLAAVNKVGDVTKTSDLNNLQVLKGPDHVIKFFDIC